MHAFDVVVVGAGAAGLFCAGVAGQLGLKVVLIDHSERVAEKIRISGGGRCNFTNTGTGPAHFLSANPRFCRSALSRYTPQHFIDLVRRHGIGFHEKHKGQLFCDRSAKDLIDMLLAECQAGGVSRWQGCAVHAVRHKPGHGYEVDTAAGLVHGKALVIATGGLSIPQTGASGFGYEVAQQFGLAIEPTRPALVPLTFEGAAWAPFAELSGLALPVSVETGEKKSRIHFDEDLLFTHRGLSGPAALQISSHWQEGGTIRLNLAPGHALAEQLLAAKARSRKIVANELSAYLPSRLADAWIARGLAAGQPWQRPINEAPDKALLGLAQGLQSWELTPQGTEGYRKAEVTAGGVSTAVLSSQTMESRQSGLYFIGEVVDVTGWLGGYNFQWAWASAWACAQGLAAALKRQ